MKTIYAAGFDLFAPDGDVRVEKNKALCRQYGFEPIELPDETLGTPPTAEEIFRLNIARIDACDVVAANLNPYRGSEPDSGTAYEVGYAFAKGKPVFGYMDDTRTAVEKLGGKTDENGWTVEDFGMPLNLMLACSGCIVQGTLEDCLRVMAQGPLP